MAWGRKILVFHKEKRKMCIFDSTTWGKQKSANALEVKILIFHWENVYFLDTEEGLLVA